MLYVVDGYNVTRSDPATRALSIEEQREALVRRLAARGASMLGAGTIVVVFDGMGGTGGSNRRLGTVDVRYARTHSADDEIVGIVTRAAEKVVLVTDDVELAERARVHARHGLDVRSRSCCFDDAGKGSARRSRTPRPARDSGLPKGANRITEDLKKIWLDDKEE